MFRRDSPDGEDFEAQRAALVDRLAEAGRFERASTIEAMRTVPRQEFVPESRREEAYADRPLPIGADQTVSAPHMVGIMCDHLELEPGDDVLEIGTGCGYHAAVTTEIVGDGTVYSVEYVDRLAREARERLADLGYAVHVRVGDGHDGWPE
ncbi:protein-L-isoaspartate O-methyltransferase, partial [Halobacteriales archaeon SW_12_69_24]